jgi:hypothetical protein
LGIGAEKRESAGCDIIPFTIYQFGGAGEFIDVEDVFVYCYKLAPERFGWRKHTYPNFKSHSKALWDYEGKYPNHLIKTSDGLRRQLQPDAKLGDFLYF